LSIEVNWNYTCSLTYFLIIFTHANNILTGVYAYFYNCQAVAQACLFPVLLCTMLLKHRITESQNGRGWKRLPWVI